MNRKTETAIRTIEQGPARRGTIRIENGKVVRTEETIGEGSRTDSPAINVNNYRTLHSRGKGDYAAS